jgi:hypothetical protein
MTEISHTRAWLHPGIPCLVGSRAISNQLALCSTVTMSLRRWVKPSFV